MPVTPTELPAKTPSYDWPFLSIIFGRVVEFRKNMSINYATRFCDDHHVDVSDDYGKKSNEKY